MDIIFHRVSTADGHEDFGLPRAQHAIKIKTLNPK